MTEQTSTDLAAFAPPADWRERAAAAGLGPADGQRRYYVVADAFGGYVAAPDQRI